MRAGQERRPALEDDEEQEAPPAREAYAMTYWEIGAELGLSGERVRQIERRALEKIRGKLASLLGIIDGRVSPKRARDNVAYRRNPTRARLKAKERYRRLTALGLCGRCGAPRDGKGVYCVECRVRRDAS